MRLIPVVVLHENIICPTKIIKYIPNVVTQVSPYLSIIAFIVSTSLCFIFICKYKLITKKLF